MGIDRKMMERLGMGEPAHRNLRRGYRDGGYAGAIDEEEGVMAEALMVTADQFLKKTPGTMVAGGSADLLL